MKYNDTNISYGCIAHLYNIIQNKHSLKDKNTEIILVTLLKFHNMGIVTFEKKNIKFNYENLKGFKNLDSNEKLIYNSIKNLSTDNILTVDNLINSFSNQYLFLRDRFIDINLAIENDLKNNEYINKKKKNNLITLFCVLTILSISSLILFIKSFNFIFVIILIVLLFLLYFNSYELRPINLLSKKSYKFLKSLKEQLYILNQILQNQDSNLNVTDLENCAKISIILGYYDEFMKKLDKKSELKKSNSFLNCLKYYKPFIDGEKFMEKQEQKIQKNLQGISPSISEMIFVLNNPKI